MKRLFLSMLAVIGFAGIALAGGNELAYFKFQELTTLTRANIASGDLIPVYDASTTEVKAVPADFIGVGAGSEVVTAANTIAATECGTTFFLGSATGFASTLPAATDGCEFNFYVTTSPTSGNHTIVTSDGTEILYGGVNELEVDTGDDGPSAAGDVDTISFISAASGASNSAAVGDYATLRSDGTNWYVVGQVKLDGALTFTSAS